MLSRIKAFFDNQLSTDGEPANQEHRLQLAAAALLIETAKADFVREEQEAGVIEAALSKTFDLSDEELAQLLDMAEEETSEATSLYQFTRLINDHYDEQRKIHLIKLLWRVAYADGEISKYEDHLIRRVAELTYVSHKDFIAAKLAVEQERGS